MADLSSIFLKFNKEISLTPTEIRYLRNARKTVTNKIKGYFKEVLNQPAPKFVGQGSFSMRTLVKPIEGAYDIDIGICLQGYSNWQNDWPKPETASNWIKKALENHTSSKPINKKTCIRIIYKPKTSSSDIYYHVDLPIYVEYTNLLGEKHTRIGLNGDRGWSEKSDPIGFTDWFKKVSQENQYDKSQFMRIVKYLKAWKDFQKSKGGVMPNGMLLTVLAGSKYTPDKRDDIAFYETIRKIYNKLNLWSYDVYKPVQPYNNLGKYLDKKQWQNFLVKLERLVDDAKVAINSNDNEIAKILWSKHFDYRFDKN